MVPLSSYNCYDSLSYRRAINLVWIGSAELTDFSVRKMTHLSPQGVIEDNYITPCSRDSKELW